MDIDNLRLYQTKEERKQRRTITFAKRQIHSFFLLVISIQSLFVFRFFIHPEVFQGKEEV